MSDNLSAAQFSGSGPASCPECGSAGKPESGSRSGSRLSHVETPPECRTYTWSSGGAFIARDAYPKSVRDARAAAADAKLRKLNPFRAR